MTESKKYKIIFVYSDGKEKIVYADEGLSLLDIAHDNDIDLEGACGGALACSTCHLIIEEQYFDKLEPATEEEEDMLDLAFGVKATSRLGCQVIVSEALDGARILLPPDSRNINGY